MTGAAPWRNLVWVGLAVGWTIAVYEAGASARGALIHAAWQAQRIANARAVLNAAERTLDAERALSEGLATRDQQHQKELDLVQQQHDDFVERVRIGALRVSIPVRAAACPTEGAAAAATSGHAAETRAELEPAAAATLAGIARDGDSAIVDLNACIDHYNAARTAASALNDAQAE